ncbi:MAG: GIY-YIG nuclease family protein [Thermoguttaceae bacterium]|nr:GIY-YIG nuclease family protein [Thermoguttaceae bacterium]MBQ7812929.1 GIY-YIG nuclease family protein [Thermoguttaceae bacterium]MBQ8362298.1 GIY-YIG nuclease family protein [Thermoguttaceae bacterium]
MWYYSEKGKEYGPFDRLVIVAMIRQGALHADSSVRKATWKKAKTVKQAFPEELAEVETSASNSRRQADRLVVPPDEPIPNPPFLTREAPIKPNGNTPPWFWLALAFIAAIVVIVGAAEGFSSLAVVLLVIGAAVASGLGVYFTCRSTGPSADAETILQHNQATLEQAKRTFADYAQKATAYQGKLQAFRQELVAAKKKVDADAEAARTVRVAAEELAKTYLALVVEHNKKKLDETNYATCKERLSVAIASCRQIGIEITAEDEKRELDALKRDYELAVRAAFEREEQARIRKQIREEERLQRKLREEEEKARREKAAIEKALAEAKAKEEARRAAELAALQAQLREAAEAQRAAEVAALEERLREAEERAKDDAAAQSAEIAELQEKLADAEARATRALSMAQQTRAGHVYILSNIGSFGEDVYKVGMTRRLEPQERVDELSGASVPFPFDVHMMLSCDDAPALENALHRALHKKRVNKVNVRKEFFRVPLDEIIEEAKKHCATVEYVADAEALQYYESLRMTDEDVEFVESVRQDAYFDDED